MALQAWVPVEEKLFAADSSGAVQEIAAANLQALQPEAIILFDYKKLLKKYGVKSTAEIEIGLMEHRGLWEKLELAEMI